MDLVSILTNSWATRSYNDICSCTWMFTVRLTCVCFTWQTRDSGFFHTRIKQSNEILFKGVFYNLSTKVTTLSDHSLLSVPTHTHTCPTLMGWRPDIVSRVRLAHATCMLHWYSRLKSDPSMLLLCLCSSDAPRSDHTEEEVPAG